MLPFNHKSQERKRTKKSRAEEQINYFELRSRNVHTAYAEMDSSKLDAEILGIFDIQT